MMSRDLEIAPKATRVVVTEALAGYDRRCAKALPNVNVHERRCSDGQWGYRGLTPAPLHDENDCRFQTKPVFVRIRDTFRHGGPKRFTLRPDEAND